MPDAALIASIEEALAGRGARRCGAEIRFRCVVEGHADEHPSARWHPERHTWYCDVCGIGGGAVDLAGRLGVIVPRRRATNAERRAMARRDAEHRDREAHTFALRVAWHAALAELRGAQADVALLRAVWRDDPEERDPRTRATLDALGDPYLREQVAEQRLTDIEREDRALRQGVTRVAA